MADSRLEQSTASPGPTGILAGERPSSRTDFEAPIRRSVRQWVTLGVVVVLMATVCVFLGRWQWHRHEARQAQIAQIVGNYDAPPVALSDLATATHPMTQSAVWRPVTVTGTYLTDATVLLRNRPWSDGAGFHVLVPFVAEDGTVLIVDRGFVKGIEAPPTDQIAAPASGPVALTVRLRMDEPTNAHGTVDNQVYAINTDQTLAAGGLDPQSFRTTGAYGVMVTESPAATTSLVSLPAPDTDPRSHLSYAFQWWAFAVGLIAMFLIAINRERRGRLVTLDDVLSANAATVDPANADSPTWGGGHRQRVRRVDESDEDSQIDTQLHR